MVKRAEHEKKKSHALLSPYSERVVNPAPRLSNQERCLYFWVMTWGILDEYVSFSFVNFFFKILLRKKNINYLFLF